MGNFDIPICKQKSRETLFYSIALLNFRVMGIYATMRHVKFPDPTAILPGDVGHAHVFDAAVSCRIRFRGNSSMLRHFFQGISSRKYRCFIYDLSHEVVGVEPSKRWT
jgi:hypothetical protein